MKSARTFIGHHDSVDGIARNGLMLSVTILISRRHKMRVYYYFNPAKKGEGHAKENIEVLEDILEKRRIKISRIAQLNDPFDFQVSFDSTTPEGYVSGFRNKFKQIDNNLGIVCFSVDATNVLMWSHYANKHQGLVLGLDVDDNALTQVDYLPIAPRVIPNGGSCKGCSHRFAGLMNAVMRTKAVDWAYEKEWRLILDYSNRENIQEEKDGTRYYLLPPNSIREIFIGLRSKIKSKDVFSCLHRRGLDKVSVYEMKQAFDGYSLVESCKGTYERRQKQIKLHIHRMIKRIKNE